jgi:hypothetical protein
VIVYRDQRSRADPRRMLSQLRSTAGRPSLPPPSHERVRDILIDLGVLECAVADSLFTDADGLDPLVEYLHAASLAAAHVFWHSWHDHPDDAGRWWHRLGLTLEEIHQGQLPREVEVTTPEGYAHYSLYPEMYLEAAKRCHSVLGDFPAVCLGLRSIGSGLSAVVAAALTELGCQVASFTVRPRGHPYARTLHLDQELVTRITSPPHATYLIVDEGPGFSGSSFGSAVTMLRGLGVPDERICLFPSWRTDGSHLRSSDARQSWSRHRQFISSFEEVWLDSGRFAAVFPGELRDLSAGAWRESAYSGPDQYPAVQPQHERRKYLLASGATGSSPMLLRFAGLGRRAEAKQRRAEGLADAGFTPRPEVNALGFVLRSFVPGRPVAPGETDAQLIDVVASYLAHLCRAYPSEPSVSDSSLREMITANVAEGFQDADLDRRVLELPVSSWTDRAVALDGRMLAHEWIRTPSGYLKVDAVDHHDDHFFPGCQDVAWDMAASVIELKLGLAAEEHLVERYRALSDDHTIAERLPLYSIAYLAFRLGYTRLATGVLGSSADGKRFMNDSRRYAGMLSQRLNAWSVAGSHA